MKPTERGDLAVPDEGDETPLPGWLSWLQEWKFVRDRTITADHIAYAQDGAYACSEYWPVRYANLFFAHVLVPIGILLCDAIKWAFFQRLIRCIIAIPTTLALMWALNHVPVVAWLIPDGWDFTTWWADPASVEVPIDDAGPVG